MASGEWKGGAQGSSAESSLLCSDREPALNSSFTRFRWTICRARKKQAGHEGEEPSWGGQRPACCHWL